MHLLSQIIYSLKSSTCFGRSFRSSSGAQNCVYSNGICQTAAATCCYRGWDGTSSTLSWPTALDGGEGSASRPGRSLPPGKTRYPLYRRLGGPQGRSGQVWKISPPPEFDPRTVQPVASRYTDWATRPTHANTWADVKERKRIRTVQSWTFLVTVYIHTWRRR